MITMLGTYYNHLQFCQMSRHAASGLVNEVSCCRSLHVSLRAFSGNTEYSEVSSQIL